jgi:hypothetical protein
MGHGKMAERAAVVETFSSVAPVLLLITERRDIPSIREQLLVAVKDHHGEGGAAES